MRPQHGREEVHPGRWKEMESNNNGELYKMLDRTNEGASKSKHSTKERKYSNPNGTSEGQEEDPNNGRVSKATDALAIP